MIAPQHGKNRKEVKVVRAICNDRLLCVEDVVECTGLCSKTAYALMESTNAVVRIGSRKYVFETDLFKLLKSLSTEAGVRAAS